MSYTQTSRNIASCQIADGTFVSFFNDAVTDAGAISWYDRKNRLRYMMVVPNSDVVSKHRVLKWNRYYVSGSGNTSNSRIVPFLPKDNLEDKPDIDPDVLPEGQTSLIRPIVSSGLSVLVCSPLYEAICPSISSMTDSLSSTIVFWTNLDPSSVQVDNVYHPENVYKISELDYSIAVNAGITRKALCSAKISFEFLKQVGGGFNDSRWYYTPVIREVKILCFSNEPIFDFSGGSGGIGRHSHLSNSNNDCGFAYSVFAPGTSLKPISWV